MGQLNLTLLLFQFTPVAPRPILMEFFHHFGLT
jgi:hypothetical protein